MAQNGSASKGEKPTINGDIANSQTVNHVFSYPLVHELATTYQGTSLGALSINTYNSLYATFVDPVKPYLRAPLAPLAPYLQQADALGASSLDTIDGHFPALRSTDVQTLRGYAAAVLSFPLRAAGDGGRYVLRTYDDEYGKMAGEDGVVKSGRAVVSTELRIASEALHAVADYLGPRKEELKEGVEKAKKTGAAKLDQAKAQTKAQAKAE